MRRNEQLRSPPPSSPPSPPPSSPHVAPSSISPAWLCCFAHPHPSPCPHPPPHGADVGMKGPATVAATTVTTCASPCGRPSPRRGPPPRRHGRTPCPWWRHSIFPISPEPAANHRSTSDRACSPPLRGVRALRRAPPYRCPRPRTSPPRPSLFRPRSAGVRASSAERCSTRWPTAEAPCACLPPELLATRAAPASTSPACAATAAERPTGAGRALPPPRARDALHPLRRRDRPSPLRRVEGRRRAAAPGRRTGPCVTGKSACGGVVRLPNHDTRWLHFFVQTPTQLGPSSFGTWTQTR
jgi:hypothetical protein